jgi:hypothetical protein
MSRFTATTRPADLLFGDDRVRAINSDRCVPEPIGCGGYAHFEEMTEVELKEYPISGLCVKCQRNFFGGGYEY